MKRRGVKDRYGFDCCCEACEEDGKTDRERREIRALKRRLLDRPMKEVMMKGGLVEEVKRDMDRFVVKLEEQRLLNLARYAHERAIEVYLAAGTEVEKTKEHVLKLIDVRRRLFGAKDEEIVVLMRGYLDL